MNEIMKARITERMEALNMNPSSVALEAGLSRSAVRDILSGKAKNPGTMTVHRIAHVLKCSDNYLMGYSDDKFWAEATDILIDAPARLGDSSGTIEAGVFRQNPKRENKWDADDPFAFAGPDYATPRERKALKSPRRYHGRDLYLYIMGDNSLNSLSIIKNDILIAFHEPRGDGMQFVEGKIFIVSHRVPGLDAEELSARVVQKRDGKPHLVTSSIQTVFAPIVVTEKAEEPNTYHTAGGGHLVVEGIVAEVTRQLDV